METNERYRTETAQMLYLVQREMQASVSSFHEDTFVLSFTQEGTTSLVKLFDQIRLDDRKKLLDIACASVDMLDLEKWFADYTEYERRILVNAAKVFVKEFVQMICNSPL